MLRFIQIPLLLVIAISSFFVSAATDDKPFAEHRVVLQISDPDPFKQTLVLNVANNIINHYGIDKVDIEIVTFGPGLRLLFDNNSNTGRIDALYKSGVRFAACQNTISGMAKKLGYKPKLISQATPVTAGVVRIIDLVSQGYTLIKP